MWSFLAGSLPIFKWLFNRISVMHPCPEYLYTIQKLVSTAPGTLYHVVPDIMKPFGLLAEACNK